MECAFHSKTLPKTTLLGFPGCALPSSKQADRFPWRACCVCPALTRSCWKLHQRKPLCRECSVGFVIPHNRGMFQCHVPIRTLQGHCPAGNLDQTRLWLASSLVFPGVETEAQRGRGPQMCVLAERRQENRESVFVLPLTVSLLIKGA